MPECETTDSLTRLRKGENVTDKELVALAREMATLIPSNGQFLLDAKDLLRRMADQLEGEG